MKLIYFISLLLIFIGCQKTPPPPHHSLKINYLAPIDTAYKAKSLPQLFALTQEIQASNGQDTFLALAYRRIGALYNDNQQADSAIAATQKALTILQHCQPSSASDIAKCKLNIGIYLLYEDSYDSAQVYLTAALPMFEALSDMKNVFNTQNNLLRLHIKRQDYAQATLIEKSIQHFVDDTDLADDVRKDWHSNLGLLALSLLKEDTSKVSPYKEKAIFHYDKAIKYLNQNSKKIAVLWINKADAYIHCNDFYNAQNILNQALPVFKQAKDILNEATCLTNLAVCYLETQPIQARDLLLNADKLLKTLYKNKSHVSRTEIYSNLGNLHWDKKEYLQAAETYQQAIEHACSGNKDYVQQLNQQKVFNFNAPEQLLFPLKHKAKALFQQYLLDKNEHYLLESLKIYETLDEYITRTRGLMTADESKFAYSEKVIAIYEDAMAAAMTAYRLDKRYADYILRFMAHSKAAVLQESVQQDTAKRWANIPQNVQEQELSLKWAIAKAQKALSQADSAHQANTYQLLLNATENWEQFVQSLETKYPVYYHSKYAGLKVLKINTLQKYLSKDRMIIDYFWGQKTLYTATITQNHFEMDSIPNTPALQQQIKSWVYALHTNIINDSIKQQLTQHSYALYQQLLEKSLQKLPNPNNIRSLTIIPDGSLNLLPFEALTQKPIKTWLKNDTSAALIWKYAISYAYSNTLLWGAPQNNANAPQDLGGFGINYKKKYVNESVDKKASRLRNAEKDVIIAKQLFPNSQIWTESAENAHLESFYRNAPNCKILYLSMHGVVDNSTPLKSGLIFAKKDSLQLLQLSDIQGLELPYNDLTILSACNTSLGKLSQGEGLISLSRAFSFTGTRSLLTTRWSLDEDAGSLIIEHFLKYLKQGISKDIALQKAKQDYLKQGVELAPNYWASTVLVGDIEPLSQSNSYWIWIISGFIFLILLIWKLLRVSWLVS